MENDNDDIFFDPKAKINSLEEKIDKLQELLERHNSNPTNQSKTDNTDLNKTFPDTDVKTHTNGRPVRDWEYYKQIRKGNPNLYYQPKTQREMMDDINALGDDKFWKRDRY